MKKIYTHYNNIEYEKINDSDKHIKTLRSILTHIADREHYTVEHLNINDNVKLYYWVISDPDFDDIKNQIQIHLGAGFIKPIDSGYIGDFSYTYKDVEIPSLRNLIYPESKEKSLIMERLNRIVTQDDSRSIPKYEIVDYLLERQRIILNPKVAPYITELYDDLVILKPGDVLNPTKYPIIKSLKTGEFAKINNTLVGYKDDKFTQTQIPYEPLIYYYDSPRTTRNG